MFGVLEISRTWSPSKPLHQNPAAFKAVLQQGHSCQPLSALCTNADGSTETWGSPAEQQLFSKKKTLKPLENTETDALIGQKSQNVSCIYCILCMPMRLMYDQDCTGIGPISWFNKKSKRPGFTNNVRSYLVLMAMESDCQGHHNNVKRTFSLDLLCIVVLSFFKSESLAFSSPIVLFVGKPQTLKGQPLRELGRVREGTTSTAGFNTGTPVCDGMWIDF